MLNLYLFKFFIVIYYQLILYLIFNTIFQLNYIYKLRYLQFMSISRKAQNQSDLKAVLAKEIGAKNPVFSADFITELHGMFSLYADPRQRRADVRDILMTAKTLGLDSKFEIVYRALEQICQSVGADALDFETFLKELTAKVGNPYTEEGRKANFALLDTQGKGELDINDMRYINDQLKYGYQEEFLHDLIKSVGGFGAETVTSDKYCKLIDKKVKQRRTGI